MKYVRWQWQPIKNRMEKNCVCSLDALIVSLLRPFRILMSQGRRTRTYLHHCVCVVLIFPITYPLLSLTVWWWITVWLCDGLNNLRLGLCCRWRCPLYSSQVYKGVGNWMFQVCCLHFCSRWSSPVLNPGHPAYTVAKNSLICCSYVVLCWHAVDLEGAQKEIVSGHLCWFCNAKDVDIYSKYSTSNLHNVCECLWKYVGKLLAPC